MKKAQRYYLGLDVGGTNLAAGVVNADGRIIAKASMPAGACRSIKAITDDMAAISMKAVEQSGLSMDMFASWGIGMPSCVNKHTNLLVYANCFRWKNVPIYDYLRDKMPLPVYIENDANCAVLGEAKAGAAMNNKNALMLTLGTGVGGGIILDGKMYSGADALGAELGHTKLMYRGERCTCGQQGCLEAYCSSTALIREGCRSMQTSPDSLIAQLCEGDTGRINGKMIFDAAKQGDKEAMRIVDNYIHHLAAGISSFIVIFRPEVIILGGGISHCGDALFVPLNQYLKECTYGADVIGIPEVIPAVLGNDAGIIGAAFLGENAVSNC